MSFQELILSGTATKANWSRLFNSQKEYEQWLELRKGGIDEVRRTYNILDDFNITSFDLSDNKKDPYDKYYNTYEILGTIVK
jgi:hypothetical protein